MSGQWRVVVDHHACVGTGLCADAEPQCFKVEGGRSEVLLTTVDPNDAYLAVVEDCPVEAVAIYDADTGARIAPPGPGMVNGSA